MPGIVPALNTVQPRVYGELDGGTSRSSHAIGSAPRVRGTQRRRRADRERNRFSPACTGNSKRGRLRRGQVAVQPRVYGELRASSPGSKPLCGSAPRVRGTLRGALRRPADRRFSPACTGNSPVNATGFASSSVQPRVYGELKRNHWTSHRHRGSAPRVRGTHFRFLKLYLRFRFSPACTGNSNCCNMASVLLRVQPRVYGELS